MIRTATAVVMCLVVTTSLSAQQVRARVVDDINRQPLAGVRVTVIDSSSVEQASAVTGADGFFTIERVQPGSYTLVVEQAGYAPVRQPLVVGAEGDVMIPAIVLKQTAIALDPLEVDARIRESRIDLEGAHSTFVISSARMAQLERVSASGPRVVRQLAAGLRVRELGSRSVCVESRRRYVSMRDIASGRDAGCNMVVVVLDGVVVSNGSRLLGGMNVGAYESIEYLPPVQAGQLYGMDASANGAIVLWTRGFGPHRSEARSGGG